VVLDRGGSDSDCDEYDLELWRILSLFEKEYENYFLQKKTCRIWDPEYCKRRNAVERFSSWIEAFKKIVPRYEGYKYSFMGLICLAGIVMIGRVLG
jgi:hypothetical protein